MQRAVPHLPRVCSAGKRAVQRGADKRLYLQLRACSPAMLPHPGTPYRRLGLFPASRKACTLTQVANPERRTPGGLARQGLSAGRHLRRRRAPTSRCSARSPSASSCACSTHDGDRDPGRRCPRSTGSSGTASCPTSSRASATATASTARTTRQAASAATRTSCCSTPTPRPSTAPFDWDQSLFGYPFGDAGQPQRRRLRGQHAQVGGRSTRSSTGAPTARRDPRVRTTPSSTRRTSRASPRRTPTSPSSCAAPTPAVAHPAIIEHLKRLGVTADRADAGAPVRQRPHLIDKGLSNYWGYNTIGVPRAGPQLQQQRARRAARCRSSRRWCATCTRRASR